MIEPKTWEIWRMRVNDILINKRCSNPKTVTVISVEYKEDSQADFIRTSDSAIYGCAINIEDAGWHKK